MKRIIDIVKQVRSLPKVSISLSKQGKVGKDLYAKFMKRHPKFFLVRKKTIGVGIVDLAEFTDAEAYVKSVNGKNSAAYFARKAVRQGYSSRMFNPNEYANQIHEIHLSASERQGRALSEAYNHKITNYPLDDENVYFGVFHEDELVAYSWCLLSGELQIISRIMGHQNHLNGGVMYLLVTDLVANTKQALNGIRYIMYDTFFGASDGLKMYKKRCGFKAYWVKWQIK